MSIPGRFPAEQEEHDDHEEVFLDDSDIIHEVDIDNEDLPDADDEDGSESEFAEDHDDSMHIFTGHTASFIKHQKMGSCLSPRFCNIEESCIEGLFCIKRLYVSHVCELYTVACSPTDAKLVATGGGDDKGFLWKIGEGDWASELQGHTDSVSSLAYSSDGQLLASGGFDGVIKIWDTAGNLKCTLDGPGGGIEWVRWHPRGHLILAGSEDSTVWMWNADRGAYLNMFSGHASNVTCGDFTPDGKTICTGSDDATLRVWNPKNGENIHVVRGHPYHTDGLTCLAISHDSTLALTGSKDHSVHIVNITTGKVVSSLVSHSDSVECIGLSSSSPWAATGGMDQKLIIWDLQHSSPRSICDHEYGVTCLAWIDGSRFVATGCVDGKVRLWDSLSGDCVQTFSGHADAIQSLSVSANRDFLVSVSLDRTARVFEIANYQ